MPTKEQIKAELKKRAERGAKSLLNYPGYVERRDFELLDDEDFICLTIDLVTDLLHLALSKWRANPDYIVQMAFSHFTAEQAGELEIKP
jgi:hypothetical protein